MEIWKVLLAFAAGYAASIYSWSWIRTQVRGVSAEAAKLRERARALEEKFRSL